MLNRARGKDNPTSTRATSAEKHQTQPLSEQSRVTSGEISSKWAASQKLPSPTCRVTTPKEEVHCLSSCPAGTPSKLQDRLLREASTEQTRVTTRTTCSSKAKTHRTCCRTWRREPRWAQFQPNNLIEFLLHRRHLNRRKVAPSPVSAV